MNNLESFNNIYADLAESAYIGRPKTFVKYQNSNESIEVDYSLDVTDENKNTTKGGKTLPNNGKVYLQPDTTVKAIQEYAPASPTPYLSPPPAINEYQKGLLVDEKSGYNSYYVTDTPTLSNDTKHTYFTTRGSDEMSWSTLNDWVSNNAMFTLFDAHIPQAKLAREAMHEKISEMSEKAPKATMAITGHSLGTMVSIQAVANLPKEDLDKVDKVVLFQGPDARESINKMSKQAQENIKTLEEQGKIEYYVNASDIVSMLNRNKKGVDEIGKVHYLIPKSFNTTFDMDDKYGSSHDFGQYQVNDDGTLKEANLKDHPYIFVMGIKVSRLIDKYLDKITKASGETLAGGLAEILSLSLRGASGVELNSWMKEELGKYQGYFADFQKEYNDIINEAKIASEWPEKVADLQNRIATASGGQKIELRKELANAVASKAKIVGEEYKTIFENEQQESEDELSTICAEITSGAFEIKKTLSWAEVQEIISPYEKASLWDSAQATSNNKQVTQYCKKTTDFKENLLKVAKNIEDYDQQAAEKLFNYE